MLARLEAQNLLTQTSEVKNLGLIMALYIKAVADLRSGFLLEDEEEVTDATFTWTPSNFEDYINAYSTKYGITLHGPPGIDDLTSNLDSDVTLPTAEASWGWTSAYKAYKRSHGNIGGDGLDITTWSSADRKKYRFDSKDPLKAPELKALKAGAVMSFE